MIKKYLGVLLLIVFGTTSATFGYAERLSEDTLLLFKKFVEQQSPGNTFTYGAVSVNATEKSLSIRDLTISVPSKGAEITVAEADIVGDDKDVYSIELKKMQIGVRSENSYLNVDRVSMSGLNLSKISKSGSGEKVQLKTFLIGTNLTDFLFEGFKFDNGIQELISRKIQFSELSDGVFGEVAIFDVILTDNNVKEVREMGFKNFSARQFDLKRFFEEDFQSAMSDIYGASEMALLGLYGISDHDAQLSFSRLSIDGVRRDEGLITAAVATIDGAELSKGPATYEDKGLVKFLNTIETDTLRVDAKFSHDLNYKNLSVKQSIQVSADGLGALVLVLDFSDVNPDILRQMARGEQEQINWSEFMSAKLVKMSLNYDDEILADHIIDDMSEGDRPALAKRTAILAAAFVGPDEQAANMVLQAVSKFIIGANRFHVSAHPSAPAQISSFEQAYAEGSLSRILGLTVSGE